MAEYQTDSASAYADTELNVNSLWLIGPRGKGGKHSNFYHGNFAPQIPNQMIRRFTREGDVVLDMFMGSGTTLFECEALNRNFIGFDINQMVLDYVGAQMCGTRNICYRIHNQDVTDRSGVAANVEGDLRAIGRPHVDLMMIHPPYLDIVKFTEHNADLSHLSDVGEFTGRFIQAVRNCYPYLRPKGHFVLVIGDVYRDSEIVPLGFYLMDALRSSLDCKLKGILVKDMVGNRAKIGLEGLWRARALRNGNYLFKHEYVFVFRKMS